jgi:hypothetical protein
VAETPDEASGRAPGRKVVGALIAVLALAAGLGVGLFALPRGGGAKGSDAEARYAEMIRGAALCMEGGDTGRARHMLAACPENLRGWEWHYLQSIGPDASGFPATHLTATPDGMGFSAENDPGAAVPPPEALTASVLLEAMGPDWPAPDPAARKGAQSAAGLPTDLADAIVSAAFSPDGLRIATASTDGKVRIWPTELGGLLLTVPGFPKPRRVWFSRDGSLLFVAAEGKALVYVAGAWRPQLIIR